MGERAASDNWTNAEYIAGPATLPCFVSGIEVGLRNFGNGNSGFGIDGDYLGIGSRTSDLLFPDEAAAPAFLGAWADTSQIPVTGNIGTVMASTLTVTP